MDTFISDVPPLMALGGGGFSSASAVRLENRGTGSSSGGSGTTTTGTTNNNNDSSISNSSNLKCRLASFNIVDGSNVNSSSSSSSVVNRFQEEYLWESKSESTTTSSTSACSVKTSLPSNRDSSDGELWWLCECLICVFGINIFFMIFGFVQEKILHLGDRSNGDRFVFGIFLVFVMCITNSISSFLLLILQQLQRRKGKISSSSLSSSISSIFCSVDRYATRQLLAVSFTYILSMLATNYSVQHVNFPTMVLMKSAKMVPIVVGGFLVFGRTYPWYDYMAVISISGAIAAFNFSKPRSSAEQSQNILGLFLLVVALICDGLTGPRQDRLLSKYKFSSLFMMFYTNMFGILWTGIAFIIFEGMMPFQFCRRHPETIQYLVMFGISGALGQIFVFYALTCFGSLYLAFMTTTRKFFSVAFSVMWFEHKLSRMQWGCVSVIFGALFVQSICKKMGKKKCCIS